MIRVVFVLLTGFFASLLELWCGNVGVALPFVAGAVFYFTVAYGWKWGLGAAVAAGLLLELLYARGIWVAVAAGTILGLGVLWGRGRQATSLAAAALPGFLAGFLGLAPFYLARLWMLDGRADVWVEAIVMIAFAMLFMAAWLPLSIWWLDRCAARLGLPLYQKRDDE